MLKQPEVISQQRCSRPHKQQAQFAAKRVRELVDTMGYAVSRLTGDGCQVALWGEHKIVNLFFPNMEARHMGSSRRI